MFLLFSLSMSHSSAETQRHPGIIIPLYTYPTDSSWAQTIRAKQAYPKVPFVVIIDPGSGPGGPGASSDPKFVSGVTKLQNAGITVIGYDYTSDGARSISAAEADVRSYVKWYHVNGIFFDEMAYDGTPSHVTYYKNLEAYSVSEELTMTVGNPGTPVPSDLVGIFNVLCIYENSGMPTISAIDGYRAYGPAGFYFIAHGVTGFPSSQVLSDLSYVNWIYVTNAGEPYPYSKLPTYFSSEVAFLQTGCS
jgi:hypothetical protein